MSAASTRPDGRAAAALVIVGKAPEPGRTKTRLSPPLTLEQGARLYAGFLLDTVALGVGLGWGGVTLIYPPRPGAAEELSRLLPPELGARVRLQPQPGEGLGAALAGAFSSHLAEGFARVVLIGSDNPSLPPALVEEARAGLADHDLVIGPSEDGGYYLIGMARPHLGVFERITWSTHLVYGETLARARELGLSVLSLPAWYDVDTVAELRRLRDDLARMPADVAPRTRALLAEVAWG